LERGYAIAHRVSDDTIVKDAASLQVGESLRVTFAKGRSIVRVAAKE
jgi:exonuclease VII large subunit